MGREAPFFSFFFLSARSTWKDGHEIKGKFFLLGEFFNINVGEKGRDIAELLFRMMQQRPFFWLFE